MTVVLTPEEINFPSLRPPNKVNPIPVGAPVDAPYVIGKPYLDPFTPPDHYAGPAPFPGMSTPAWGRKTIKSSDVPVLSQCGKPGRDFYAEGPADFWPCTRPSMSSIGMNRTLRVLPPFAGLGEGESAFPKALVVGAVAAVGTFFAAKAVLRRR